MNRSLTLPALGTLIAAVSLAAISDPVKTDFGSVAGTSNKDASVRMVKGIPFAAPPVGDLRWKIAQAPAQWEGVKMATEFSPTCANGAAGGRGRGGAPKGGAPKGGAPAGPLQHSRPHGRQRHSANGGAAIQNQEHRRHQGRLRFCPTGERHRASLQ